MKFKHLLILIAAMGWIASCDKGSHKFVISGTIAGMPAQTVILEQLNANDIITIVDSQRSDTSGKFEITGMAPEPGLYRLHFQKNRFILLSIDKGMIKVDAGWDTIENYKVGGSPGSEVLRSFIVAIREHLGDINTLGVVQDTLLAQGKDSLLAVAKKDMDEHQARLTGFVEHYVDTCRFEPNVVFAARMLNILTEANFLESFVQKLPKRFGNTRMTSDYLEHYKKTLAKLQQPQHIKGHVDVGSEAPGIALSDPDGKQISLKSFRGKVVMVDFWASWCKPCRAENPNVVAAYAKFKDKNFTILSVSLDKDKDDWVAAIKTDNLVWPNHVSDLKGWNAEPALAYGIQSIPYNFILDTSGKVIARDLRGESLIAFLEKVVR